MKYQKLPISASYRRFRALARQLRKMLADGRFHQLTAPQKHQLIKKLQSLYHSLRGAVAVSRLKKVLASGVLVAMLSTGHLNAQSFAPYQINPFGLTDVEEGYVFPQFADIDNDGDYDLFYSGYFYYNGAGEHKIFFLENTGTPQTPNFATPVENPFGLTGVDESTIMTFGDIDNDGDLDMMIGTYDSVEQIAYFENTGTASSPAFAAPTSNPFGINSIEDAAVPVLGDLDDDGDLDLLAASYSYDTYMGSFQYHENTGTPGMPSFSTVQTAPFGLGNVDDGEYISLPNLIDIDMDGDLDIMNGEAYGLEIGDDQYRAYVSFIENTGTPTNPSFEPEVAEPFSIQFPDNSYFAFNAFADLDDDGDADMLSFSYLGDPDTYNGTNSFLYFENISIVNSTEQTSTQELTWQVFPTTAKETLNYRFSDVEANRIEVYSISGRLLARYLINKSQGDLDISNWQSGLYLVQARTADGEIIGTQKVVKQ